MIFYSRVLLLAAILSLVASDPFKFLLRKDSYEEDGCSEPVTPGRSSFDPYKCPAQDRPCGCSTTDCYTADGTNFTAVCDCTKAKVEECCGEVLRPVKCPAQNRTCGCNTTDCHPISAACDCTKAKAIECCGGVPEPVKCPGYTQEQKCDCKKDCGKNICSCDKARSEDCCNDNEAFLPFQSISEQLFSLFG